MLLGLEVSVELLLRAGGVITGRAVMYLYSNVRVGLHLVLGSLRDWDNAINFVDVLLRGVM